MYVFCICVEFHVSAYCLETFNIILPQVSWQWAPGNCGIDAYDQAAAVIIVLLYFGRAEFFQYLGFLFLPSPPTLKPMHITSGGFQNYKLITRSSFHCPTQFNFGEQYEMYF